ncbi:MbnP family copper-binding protein [Glaciecola sp. 1036]|uniref:MbnP family copper-binding protein n=1 Tax=Alteromonadaceae TaxID=72275 RepID=UPI003D066463
MMLLGCSDSDIAKRQALEFALYNGATPISCEASFTHQQDIWTIENLSFFVSDLKFYTFDNKEIVPIFDESPWQNENVALIKFDTSCDDSIPSNQSLKFTFDGEMQDLHSIEFSLSVPFTQNHLNPLTQASPLNDSSMFWSWRMGYKFMRIDMTSDDSSWLFHLGSLGCVSQSSVRAPQEECKVPNRIKIAADLTSNKPIITLDIAALLDEIEVINGDSCMFNHDQTQVCGEVIKNLSSGRVFRWKE